MKIVLKKTLSIFAKLFIGILFKFSAGRFLIDKIINVVLSKKKEVSHNGINLTFHTPNRINFYRIKTNSMFLSSFYNIKEYPRKRMSFSMACKFARYIILLN